MSQIRLYIDEDAMDRQFVQALRSRNVDVLTVGEVGTTAISDEEQLIFATETGRSLYTFNVGDFCQLHYIFIVQERSHAGIIIGTQQQYSIGQQLRGVLNLLESHSVEEMINQVVYLSNFMD